MVRPLINKARVDRWMTCARADMERANKTEIRCPCRDCKLMYLIRHDSGMLESHLLRRSFMDGYTRWIRDDEYDDEDVNNGEDQDASDDHEDQDASHDHEDQGGGTGHGHEDDQGGVGHGHEDDQGGADHDSSWLRDPHVQDLLLKETSNARAAGREKAKLEQMEKDAVTPLFDGCNDGDTRLNVTLRALEMKAKHKMTDECFDDNIVFWHDILPKKGNTCPTSIAEAKKVVCPLNLPHVKYHVCINDCIIYRGEDAEKTTCPVCKTSRYKRGTKKAPRKVVWYFPLTPRLQRYFADPKEAQLMRWHAERKRPEDDDPEKEEMLRHPSDACQWKALDLQYYQHFGKESRNLRLGVSTDGLNPFGSQSSTHSTWPVFVWIYNLPLVMHEEEVRNHEYARSRAKTTWYRHQSVSHVVERGFGHVMGRRSPYMGRLETRVL